MFSLLVANDEDLDIYDKDDANGVNELKIVSVDDSGTTGTVDFNSDTGLLTFTALNSLFAPLPFGIQGATSFAYTIEDFGGYHQASATVHVTVTGVNDPPAASEDSVSVNEDGITENIHGDLLANDSDLDDGDSLDIVSVDASGAAGTVDFDPIGNTLTFTADDPSLDKLAVGESTTTSFDYTIEDSHGGQSTATVTITVEGVNDNPVAVGNSVQVDEDATTLNIHANLMENDSDPDNGDTFDIVSVNVAGLLGTVIFDEANDSLTYAADDPSFDSLAVGQTATTQFSYMIEDIHGAQATATVSITINGVNDDPTPQNDLLSIAENATTGNLFEFLLLNDSDPDNGDTFSLVDIDTTLTRGTINFDLGGQLLTYSADHPDFDGLGEGQSDSTSFTYTVEDSQGAQTTAKVNISIDNVNDPPVAIDDARSVDENQSIELHASILSNDIEIDGGDSIDIVAVDASGTLGTVIFDPATDTLTYSADHASFESLAVGDSTTTTFTYTIEDTQGAQSQATVTVTIQGVNDAPVAADNSDGVAEDSTTANLHASLLNNDTDVDNADTRDIVAVDANGTEGTVFFDDASDTLTFTADDPASDALALGDTATTTFTYTIEDTQGAQSTATVTITITGVNDGPVANSDAASADEDGSSVNLHASLLGNDTDADAGEVLDIVSVDTTGTLGSVNFDDPGDSLIFNADHDALDPLAPGETIDTAFTYTIQDSKGAQSTSSVIVTVNGVNDAPIAAGDSISVDEDATTPNIHGTLMANDGDVDNGDSFDIVSIDSSSTVGTISFDPTNDTLTFSADDDTYDALAVGDTAATTFDYTIEDTHGAQTTGTATITINGVNDDPVAQDDPISLPENVTTDNLISLLLANDSDVDAGDPLTVISVDTTGTLGTVAFDSDNGTLTYTADDPSFDGLGEGQTASTSFTYTIEDGQGAQATATVQVTIDNQNDPPIAVNDDLDVDEDGATGNIHSLLLANDTDVDSGDTKDIVSVDATGLLGTLDFDEANDTLTYIADDDSFDLLDFGDTTVVSFTYTMEDREGLQSTATVNITVHGVNDDPVAVDDTVAVDENGTTPNLQTSLLANDSDVDTDDTRDIVGVDTTATLGIVSFDDANDALSFTADDPTLDALAPGETTTTTFTYTIVDSQGGQDSATVTVTITGVNDSPVAVEDSVNVGEDLTSENLVSTLLGNDVEVDNGDGVQIVSVDTTGLLGTLEFDAQTQSLIYSAVDEAFDMLAVGETTQQSFIYTIQDTHGAQSTATVTITITGNSGPPPVGNADSFTVNQGTSGNVLDVLQNDSDPENERIFVASVDPQSAQGGTLAIAADGTNIEYTPDHNYFSPGNPANPHPDTFQYEVSDGGLTDTATVSIVVNRILFAKGAGHDGYVSGGTVFFDADLDNVRDPAEPSTQTDDQGQFDLQVLVVDFDQNNNNELEPDEGVLVMEGGVDIATGFPLAGRLKAPPKYTVVNPLTTLVVELLQLDGDLSVEQAENLVQTGLGIPQSVADRVDLADFDPFLEAANNNGDASPVLGSSSKVQDSILQIASLISGRTGFALGSIMEELFTVLGERLLTGQLLDLTDDKTVEAIIREVAAAFGANFSDEEFDGASEVIAAANAAKDQIANSGQQPPEAAQNLSKAQHVSQGDTANDLLSVGNNTMAIDDVLFRNSGANLDESILAATAGDVDGNETRSGTFEFKFDEFSVNENGSDVRAVTVVRFNGNEGAVDVLVTLADNSAVSPEDYTAGTYTVSFQDQEVSRKLNLANVIQEDALDENDETIDLTLALANNAPGDAVLGARNAATLTIVDNDVSGVFTFAANQFSITEEGENVQAITINRNSGAGGPITLIVTPSEVQGGAVEEEDFEANPVSVTFEQGQLSKRVKIPFLDDPFVEDNEPLQLDLTLDPGAHGDAQLGAITTATLLIVNTDNNSPPQITEIGDQNVFEDGRLTGIPFTVTDGETNPNVLVVTAESSNQDLIPDVFLEITGDGADRALNIRAAADRNGQATVTLTVIDEGGLQNNTTFTVNVTPQNDVPDIISSLENVNMMEDSASDPIGMRLFDQETAARSLTLTASSSNESLVGDEGLQITQGVFDDFRNLRITPKPNAFGQAVISLTVGDGISQITRQFQLNVQDVNDPPMLEAIDDLALGEDGSVSVEIHVADSETADADLQYAFETSNPGLLDVDSFTLDFTVEPPVLHISPASDAFGEAEVTLTVFDGEFQVSTSFMVLVNPVNDAPTVSMIDDLVIEEDHSATIEFTVNDKEMDASELEITVESSNPELFAKSGLVLSGAGETRAMEANPIANAFGVAEIAVTVSDGDLETVSIFQIEVVPVNDQPVLSDMGLVEVRENESVTISLPILDVDNTAEELVVELTSFNLELLPEGGLVLANSSGEWQLTITPAADRFGDGVVRVQYHDPSESVFRKTFDVRVNKVNEPPILLPIADQRIKANEPLSLVVTVDDPDDNLSDIVLETLSFDEELFATNEIAIEGADRERTVVLTPVRDRSGSAMIRIQASDPSGARVRQSFEIVVESEEPTVLNITIEEGRIVIAWEGAGELQSADSLEGPYEVVEGAVSPYEITPTEEMRFFRVMLP